jgi:hypothetical protein
MGLYLALPGSFLPSARIAVVSVGLTILVPLVVLNPVRFRRQTPWSRRLSVVLTLLLLAANQVALVQLVAQLLDPARHDGRGLLVSAAQVWVTNVIAFALLYWELDRGGPVARSPGTPPRATPPELRFAQDDGAAPHWRPTFVDYLTTSLWTSTAFSPTDALPLSHRIKGIMAWESVAGLMLFALVIARSVNLFL